MAGERKYHQDVEDGWSETHACKHNKHVSQNESTDENF